jgi:hypothetical protein
MYDELTNNAKVDAARVMDRHDDPNTDVSIGRKDPGDGVVFRVEVRWNEDRLECSPWYDPYAFEAFLRGIEFNDDLLQRL